jgi:xanthine/CO dehydrogenase XdhC/CoxF family maturation factor
MTDLDHILPLWNDLRASGTPYVLATVVEVEGSGYRKPGARMMIAADGRRAGTISGGCLEGEVTRKAFWHTSEGAVTRRYSTSPEDGEVPFGMGCGGVVHLLLERAETAEPLLERLAAHYADRTPLAVATALDPRAIGLRAFWPPAVGEKAESSESETLRQLARRAYERQSSFSSERTAGNDGVHAEWVAARPGLFVFGAGDDAIPLVRLARQLGWYISVADGRSNLPTSARFPEAHEVHSLAVDGWPAFDFRPTDAAVVMTHSLEQDTRILRSLLEEELAYIGLLGPGRRTAEMLTTIATAWGLPDSQVEEQALSWMERLHAPMGLDLGCDTPAEIALSVIAEIQQTRLRGTALPLSQIRNQIRGQRKSLAMERHRVSA